MVSLISNNLKPQRFIFTNVLALFKKVYRAPTRKIHSQPARKSRPGHWTVPPLEEWKARRRGRTNRRCPNHGEEDALGEGNDHLPSGLEQDSLHRGEQRKHKRRRVLPAVVLMSWIWTCRTDQAGALRPFNTTTLTLNLKLFFLLVRN